MESVPVLLLDGGFSNELNKRCSYNVDKESLWTAKALMTDAKAVTETHLEYLKAGADIIETATYQATTRGLQESLGLSPIECEELIANSVKLAENAVSQYKSLQDDNFFSRQDKVKPAKLPIIAGSIGPYGVYLHDGSEYSGKYMDKVTEEDIIDMHSKRLEVLINSNVDILAIETMPSLSEVEMILRFLQSRSVNAKVWVSFNLQENDPSRTAYGDYVTDAFQTVSKYSNVLGFGTNCINPKNVGPFLKLVSQAKAEAKSDIKLIVYPNVGKTWIPGQGWSEEDVPLIETYAKEWLELGANIIGGCCQVGPDEIRKLRDIVDDWNNLRGKI
ncbi:unnamed protein product [Orchesella dallaii]|uniref:Hcy-binding domain-containing protein n=1 Tax=Orchesella dallaii TaxID=48710 RepID=A0ABP1QJC3_9HEXA